MESNSFCNDKFLEEYNIFLDQLEKLFESDEDKNMIKVYKNESNENKLNRGKIFYNTIENENLFELFCKSKVKVFSSKDEDTSKISNSLFGEQLPLKKLINNQNERTKDIIWKYLHLFYFLYESDNSNRKERKSVISRILKEREEKISNDVKNDLLNVEVNDATNNMINDIVKSFETSLSGDNANPFESIMQITQNITEKYNDKIESGDIELDKLMGSIQSSIPGMPNIMGGSDSKQPKEKVIIDDNFSTDNVELGNKDEEKSSGMNLSNMLNMMNSMKGGEGGPDLGGLFGMLGKLDSIDNEEDAEKLKQEMDTYLEKELGVDVGKLNEQLEKNKLSIEEVEEASDNEPDQD